MLRITHVKFRILTKFFEKYIFNLGQTMNAKSAVKNTHTESFRSEKSCFFGSFLNQILETTRNMNLRLLE